MTTEWNKEDKEFKGLNRIMNNLSEKSLKSIMKSTLDQMKAGTYNYENPKIKIVMETGMFEAENKDNPMAVALKFVEELPDTGVLSPDFINAYDEKTRGKTWMENTEGYMNLCHLNDTEKKYAKAAVYFLTDPKTYKLREPTEELKSVIEKAASFDLSDKELKFVADRCWTNEQLDEIFKGYEHGLCFDEIKQYADYLKDPVDMASEREEIEKSLDVKIRVVEREIQDESKNKGNKRSRTNKREKQNSFQNKGDDR